MPKFVNISFPASEQRRFKRWVNSLSKENKIQCQNLIMNKTLRIARNAKAFASARGMWGISQSIQPFVSSTSLSGVVRVGKFYGPYVEWGTGRGFDRPREREIREYAALWWTHKQWKGMRARPYLFPAYRIGIKELEVKLKNMGFKKK